MPDAVIALFVVMTCEKVCVPVKVWAASVRAMVADVPGNVIVVESVPAKVIELLRVSVFPSTPAKVCVAFCVSVFPAAIVKTPVPAVKVLPLYVLFVNASEPARVARVPVVGKVTLVGAVSVRVKA